MTSRVSLSKNLGRLLVVVEPLGLVVSAWESSEREASSFGSKGAKDRSSSGPSMVVLIVVVDGNR